MARTVLEWHMTTICCVIIVKNRQHHVRDAMYFVYCKGQVHNWPRVGRLILASKVARSLHGTYLWRVRAIR